MLGTPETMSRITAGDVTGDGRLDLLVRAGANGEHLLSFDSVWNCSGSFDTGQTCTDFAIAPGLGAGGSAAIATVGSGGLTIVSFVPSFGTFVSATALTTTDWTNAKFVRTGDLDATGSLDFVGVKADGHTLIFRLNGGANVLVDALTPVLDIAVLQWLSTPAREVAVLTSTGVRVYFGDGTFANAVDVSGHTSTAMAVLRVPSAVDRVAWIGTNTGNGQKSFALMRRASAIPENQFQLPAGDASAFWLTTGDADGDLDDDVAIAKTDSTEIAYYPNSATALPWFSTTTRAVVSGSGTYATAGRPLFARFSNTAEDQLILPTYTVATGGELGLYSKQAGRVHDFLGHEVFQFQPELMLPDAEVLLLGTGAARELRFPMNFLGEVLDAPGADPLTHRLEVMVYRGSLTSNSVELPMEKRYWIDWPSNIEGSGSAANLEFRDIDIDVTDTVPDSGFPEACGMSPRFIEVRQIRIDPSTNAILAAGPTYTFGIVRDNADFFRYGPWGIEQAALRTVEGDPESTIECDSTSIEAVHASAIVIRRKPVPPSGPIPPQPVPIPGDGATVPN